MKNQILNMTSNYNISIGDLIATCFNGIFKVTKIVKRFKSNEGQMYILHEGQKESFNYTYLLDENRNKVEINSLIYFIKITDSSFKPIKSNKELCCDSSFCKPLDVFKENMIDKLEQKLKRLKALK